MSFNQISGKVHGRQLLLKRTEKPFSQYLQQQTSLVLQNDTFKDPSDNGELPIKKDSILSLPSIRRESLGSIEKINFKNVKKNKNFFEELYLQQNSAKEKALSPVVQSRFSIRMPKKLSLNRAQQRAKEKEQSIIFNYLNQRVVIKKNKKKKKKNILSKSAEKQQNSVRLYVFPSSDPRIHRRQKTEFKIGQFQKMDMGAIIKKRRSLDLSQQQNLSIIKRQSQVLNQQQKLLQELKHRVSEVERRQQPKIKLSGHIVPFQPQKKYSLTNRTIEINTPAIEQTEKSHDKPQSGLVPQIHRKKQDNLNKTNRTIEKTPKNLKISIQKNQLFKVNSPFLQTLSHKPKEEDLADTIKNNDKRHQELSSETPSKDSQQPHYSKLQEEIIQNESSDQELKIQIQSNLPSQQIETKVLKEEQVIKPKTHLNQPSRIPDKSFLNLKTFYAQISTNHKLFNRAKHPINSQQKPIIFKKIPPKQQITTFIENYAPDNEKISILKLVSSQNFEVVLQQDQQFYFGQMVTSLKSGLGITIRHNYLYEGLYLNGQKVQGLQITEVGKYQGEFKNNRKQGQGKFVWSNGEVYDGQWLNGKKHGHGAWSSLNGDTYIGEWVKGKVQGQGIHASSSGQKYEGSFHEYLKSGWGKQLLPNGDFYQGQFLNGKPNGSGIYTWKQGQTYKGEFQGGFRHGHGVVRDQDRNCFIGRFQRQETVGKCSISFKGEDSYQGHIEKGKFDGKGSLILYEEEQIWKGQWLQDIFFYERKDETE